MTIVKVIGRCDNCGYDMKLKAEAGRTRQIVRGYYAPIPDFFPIPTCMNCGDTCMIPEISDPLDSLLLVALRENLNKQVEDICTKHNVTIADVEAACRFSKKQLELVLSGSDEIDGTLVELLSIFTNVPGAFEHAYSPIIANKKEQTKLSDQNKDTHTEHCCARCGCKYGDINCSVTTGKKRQSTICGQSYACWRLQDDDDDDDDE